MGTIIGRQYTPEDENGKRDVIHLETQIDAVQDPVEGKPLREILNDIKDTLVPVGENGNKPGLITPEQIEKYDKLITNTIVLDEIMPHFSEGGYWFNIYDSEMTTIDS